jgi:hypothetical protein
VREPDASKICAPQYEEIVEIPIFEIVFRRPLRDALDARACASSSSGSAAALRDELRERREHQVRVDRGGAVADQHATLCTLRGSPDSTTSPPAAASRAHEVVMDGRDASSDGSRRAPGRPRGRRGSGCSRRGERLVGLGADRVDRALEAVDASSTGHVMSSVCAWKTSESTWRRLSSSSVAQDRVVDHELARVLGRLVEQVALRADERLARSSRRPRGSSRSAGSSPARTAA